MPIAARATDHAIGLVGNDGELPYRLVRVGDRWVPDGWDPHAERIAQGLSGQPAIEVRLALLAMTGLGEGMAATDVAAWLSLLGGSPTSAPLLAFLPHMFLETIVTDRVWAPVVAAHPATPAEVLDQFIGSFDLGVVDAAMRHPATRHSTLEVLADDYDRWHLLAARTDIPVEMLERACSKENWGPLNDTIVQVVLNPAAPEELAGRAVHLAVGPAASWGRIVTAVNNGAAFSAQRWATIVEAATTARSVDSAMEGDLASFALWTTDIEMICDDIDDEPSVAEAAAVVFGAWVNVVGRFRMGGIPRPAERLVDFIEVASRRPEGLASRELSDLLVDGLRAASAGESPTATEIRRLLDAALG